MVVKSSDMGKRGLKKSGKTGDVFYGWPLCDVGQKVQILGARAQAY